MTGLRYPCRLSTGDRIDVTAPSMGVPVALHSRLDHAVSDLRAAGFDVQVEESARRGGLAAGPAYARKDELAAAFAGPARAVLPPWGGKLAIEIVEETDWHALAADPTWFVGWSDISTLLLPLTITTGVATLHGGSLMDEPWELPTGFHRWTEVAALSEGASFTQTAAPYRRSRPWSDWDEEPLGRAQAYEEPTAWRSLRAGENVKMRGRLLGGCLETVSLLAGSSHGDLSGFARRHAPEGLIVYLEVVDSDAVAVLRTLWALRLAGWFDHANGVLIGRTTAADAPELTQGEAVERALGDLDIPIILDFDTGHQPPQMPLVNGALADVELIDRHGRITQHLIP
ncbi:S66 family peptidase [Arthrobacter sp. AOP36-C1-22]|uniref:S66 family peptidase n=1 Tax=Arthrobacter sp. AOP36-C1-22 TaxID=3457683 RepID=UPI00403428DC